MTNALYPGSFDPATNGHVDIATRAARLFEHVTIGIFDAPPKRLLFTTEERVQLFQGATKHLSNVTVTPYKGLTVEFARQIGAKTIIRGLRMISDFENEFSMALMNKKLAPEIEVVCLMTNLDYQFLSSTLLKEAAALKGNIDSLVPANVAKALKEKFFAVSERR